MAYLREGMDAHVRDAVFDRLHSPYVQFHPLMYFFGFRKAENMQKLGTPNTTTVYGGADMGKSELEETNRAAWHEFQYQKEEPDDGDQIADVGASTPTASGFAEDNVGTLKTAWTLIMEPVKIRVQSLEDAQSETAIGSVIDKSVNPVMNRWLKRVNNQLWNGTLTGAEQEKKLWKQLLGVVHTLTEDNTYGQVDRSVETNLNPLVIDAPADLQTTLVDLNINRYVNVGFTRKTSGEKVAGLAGKSDNGRGVTLFITTEELWNALADQADSRFQIHTNGIPGHALSGFTFPVIDKDGVYYTYAPDVADGCMVGLNLDTWVIEVHRKHNFQFTGFRPKWLEEEGGGMYEWGQFHTQIRQTCRMPWLNAYITNLTAR
ncbi:MAG: hypothetical protein ACLFV3_09140 [Phycisphaeraceae bacterium]